MRKTCRILAVLLTWTILGIGSVSAQNAQLIFGQKSVGISTNGDAPDNSAILDVQSANSGVLVPRLSVAQRNAIVQPATGLLVFVTDSASFYFNSGSASVPVWKRLASSEAQETFWSQYVGNAEVIRPFAQSQKVLIGDNVNIPEGYKLYVNGGILTNRVTVAFPNSALWADYVFAPGYVLKPLPEVERYVRKHRHLSDVPSAQEVSEQGVDVAKMNALLLQKIEELTLYQIQLHKLVEGLEQRIRKLEKHE